MTGPVADGPALDLAAVENLMQVLVKGLRALQLYLPNNPVYQQAVTNIRSAFAPVWEEFDELALTVVETDFHVDAKPVLQQPGKNDSMAWVLYKDGVRLLTLRPGVEEREVVNFLGVINKARNLPPDAEDDLLTLLWEQDFQFVRYNFVEFGGEEVPPLGGEPSDGPSPLGSTTAQPVTREAIRQELTSEAPTDAAGETEPERTVSGVVSMEDFDPTLYFLDDDEIEYLRAEIDREYKQDLRGNVLTILFDLFELQALSTVRAELVSIIENFIPYLLSVGDFRSVAYVLREIKVVFRRAEGILPEHRGALEQLPARLSQPESLAQLLQSLDEAVVYPTEEELGELFSELRAEALEAVLTWLPKLTNQRVRNLLHSAAQRLAQAHPAEISKALGSSDEGVLLQAIQLASGLKLSAVVQPLGELLTDQRLAVRHAAVDALAQIGSPGAMQRLERAIGDADREVRLTAVRTLSARGHRSAFPKIEAAVIGKGLRSVDLTEKTVFFEAYGLLGGPSAVNKLAEFLEAKGGFLKKKEEPETRACAAMALGKLGTPEAIALLKQAAQDKDPLVRNAVNKALRESRA